MSISTVIDGICPQFPPSAGNDGDVLTVQPDGSYDWEAPSGGADKLDLDGSNANQDIDIGENNLSAKGISITGVDGHGHIHLRKQSVDATTNANSLVIFADNNGDVKSKFDGLYYSTFKTSANTADRTYTFPNASGTVALTSDIQNIYSYTYYGGF